MSTTELPRELRHQYWRPSALGAPSPITLTEAADDWLAAAAAGLVRTRSGDPYKPAAVRAYRQALRHRVLSRLGSKRLTAISRTTLQDLADELAANGLSASSIRNTILPLRAIYRRAHDRGEVALNPTLKLALPAVRGIRERVAVPTEATALLDELPLSDRAIWATALYAGLRLGELQALDWNHIDLNQNLLNIERSWDRSAGFIHPKSRAGRRRVPMTITEADLARPTLCCRRRRRSPRGIPSGILVRFPQPRSQRRAPST